MENEKLDAIRNVVMMKARRAEQRFQLAVGALLLFEALFGLAFVLAADFRDPLHRLILFGAGAVYVPVIFGLIALGAHMNRCTLRLLSAIEESGTSGG